MGDLRAIIHPLAHWWLSFCDPDRPAGQQFLGVALVPVEEGGGIVAAVLSARALGVNPGGEVLGREWAAPGVEIPPGYVGRLLNRQEAKELEAEMHKLHAYGAAIEDDED